MKIIILAINTWVKITYPISEVLIEQYMNQIGFGCEQKKEKPREMLGEMADKSMQ